MNESPLNAWVFSTGPYMCVPHAVHAWRKISAVESTIASLSPLACTVTLSLGTTATSENAAPGGFQHFVHAQMWLCAMPERIASFTGCVAQRHDSVPPANLLSPGLSPESTDGWILTDML